MRVGWQCPIYGEAEEDVRHCLILICWSESFLELAQFLVPTIRQEDLLSFASTLISLVGETAALLVGR